MGEILKTLVTFGTGFVTGCLYTSYKFDRNPNDLIGMAIDDTRNAAAVAGESATKAVNFVKSKFSPEADITVEQPVVVEPTPQA